LHYQRDLKKNQIKSKLTKYIKGKLIKREQKKNKKNKETQIKA
jgi:hypothetical protein